MSYQVLARKWRPKRFDEVVGQRGVTETLRNALTSRRIAHSFLFAGPRGVGKTTTARILARALNCVTGPSADPCGVCDACVEIAEGRDIDVLEIDAATHTGIDKVRDVIISGLGISPVRNRYKIFIIDEVHRLSAPAFDALLKSLEEPPPHALFMMATTELEKVPQTIQSRSQVFELKAIGLKAIAEQLRLVADAESIVLDAAAVMLIARAADGSIRDALSALDQVVGFAGQTIGAADVSTVLGLVRRDLVFDIFEAIASENAPAIFELAGRAVDAGYDLRTVCRELSRAVRDLLVIAIDPQRLLDSEIAEEAERERMKALGGRFSREDLMRAFDVLSRAEQELRVSAQPRFHLEMALLRWLHLRKLVPLGELIASLESGSKGFDKVRSGSKAFDEVRSGSTGFEKVPMESPPAEVVPPQPAPSRVEEPAAKPPEATVAAPAPKPLAAGGDFKDAFLAEIRRQKKFFHGTVVVQAQRIDVERDRVSFVFGPAHRTLRAQLEQNRPWLEQIASEIAGRKVTVLALEGAAPVAVAAGPQAAQETASQTTLKARALEHEGVQAMLDVFHAEIRDVEEM
jgi:DNA polymerase-3 subunit gamma/tau